MFIHVVTMATLYHMLSTLFYVNFSFYGVITIKAINQSENRASQLVCRPIGVDKLLYNYVTLKSLGGNKAGFLHSPVDVCALPHTPAHTYPRLGACAACVSLNRRMKNAMRLLRNLNNGL